MAPERILARVFAWAGPIALSLAWLIGVCAAQTDDPQLAARSAPGAALRALQEKDLAAALASLGEAADQPSSPPPQENDGLAAAAGGVYRALAQRGGDEQYDLLYAWTMPSKSRASVRILTTATPVDAPPKEFARVLRERPRDTSFPISEIGGIRGLFSTGWTLVQMADEIGRLRPLTAELETLAERKTPNADVLLMLAKLADRRGDTTAVEDGLRRRADALQAKLAEPDAASLPIDSSDIVLAAAALRHEGLRPVSEEIFERLARFAQGGSSPRWRSFLRVAHATAAQLHHGESGAEVLYANRLKYWVPTTGMTADLHANGAVNAMWLVHEEHILHLAGAGNDVLFLRFPLTGEFDFTCETQVGGVMGTEGGLSYGGLHFEALGRPEVLTVWDADQVHRVQIPCPFIRQETYPTFNRVSIRSADGSAAFAANLHPVWFDGDAAKTSPWLGLRGFGERRPLFRNLKITGKPVIPREVRMSDGDHLRGWQAHFFGETQPPFLVSTPASELNPAGTEPAVSQADVEAPSPVFDWSIKAGVIQAAKREVQGAVSQSWLKYQRPLLEGESVRYEFFHQPGEYEVHPALGRLAFLIEPGGVRIHWITDGALDWTGLPEDNQTLEPLNRRGPRTPPLRENDWNQVVVERAEGRVTLSLNGVQIYDRPIDFGGNHPWGLYRDASKAARVRNVVMTGDWPESLPKDFLANPATVVEEAEEAGDAVARGR